MSKFRFDKMDAGESAFFSRQLEHIRPGLFEVKYSELKAMSFLPVNTSIHPGAEEYTYRWFDMVGKAELSSDYSSRGPRADVLGNEASSKIRGIKASYGYSIQEARAAMMAQLPLDMRKARAARTAIAQKIDDILLMGDGTSTYLGLYGLFKLSGTTTYTTTTGDAGETEFEDKTPDEIITDLHGLVHKVVTDTKEVERPDSMILPLSTLNYLATTRMGDGSDQTILNFFKATSPYIRNIDSSTKLETAGATSSKRIVAYAKSPDKLEAILPIEFEQLPPEQEGYEVITQCAARLGGVVPYFPKSIVYADGV